MDLNKAWQIITAKLHLWLRQFVALLPNILLAALVLTLGILLARWLKKISKKLLSGLIKHPSVVTLISSIIAVFFGATMVFIALSILKLDKAVTTLLAGAGVIGLALAFAFQDIAANFISGIFLTFRRPVSVGDIIKIKDQLGVVERINLRDTALRTFQGHIVIIPNKDVFQNPIENYSVYKKRRFDLEVGVSYAEDLSRVKELALQAVAHLEGLDEAQKTTLVYTGFGDSTINFKLRLWTTCIKQADYLEVGSQAIMAVKEVFDREGIDMPFPIRTLDFKMKGGATLADMLNKEPGPADQ